MFDRESPFGLESYAEKGALQICNQVGAIYFTYWSLNSYMSNKKNKTRSFFNAAYALVMLALGLFQLWDWYHCSEDPIWHIIFFLFIMPIVSLVFAIFNGSRLQKIQKSSVLIFPFYALFMAAFVYAFMANGGLYFVRNPELSENFLTETLKISIPTFIAAFLGSIINIFIHTPKRPRNVHGGYDSKEDEEEAREAGERGERIASSFFKRVLRKGDNMINNAVLFADGKEAEYDSIIVNRYGIFVIEVKNYAGRLYGSEDDFYWQKVKHTAAGNEYEKAVKNPIPQVKRQVYILSRFLKEHGYSNWIEGYVFLVNRNIPFKSSYVLEFAEDVDRAIHTAKQGMIDDHTVSQISKLLKSTVA